MLVILQPQNLSIQPCTLKKRDYQHSSSLILRVNWYPTTLFPSRYPIYIRGLSKSPHINTKIPTANPTHPRLFNSRQNSNLRHFTSSDSRSVPQNQARASHESHNSQNPSHRPALIDQAATTLVLSSLTPLRQNHSRSGHLQALPRECPQTITPQTRRS